MMVFLNFPDNFQMSHVVNVFQKRFRDVSQNLKVENTVWENIPIACLLVLQVPTCLSLAVIKVNKDQSSLL